MQIVLTGDLLRVSNGDIFSESDQAKNIDWLSSLIGMPIFEVEDTSLDILITREFNSVFDRVGCYSRLGMDLTIENWCSIYEGQTGYTEEITSFIQPYLEKADCILSFEAPPYLIFAAMKIGIRLVDISMAPLRFCNDYTFGIRSTDPLTNTVIRQTEMCPSIFAQSVLPSVAFAHRRVRPENSLKGALFVGQMNIDASLIQDGVFPSQTDVIDILDALSVSHGIVYYKPHPHNKDIGFLKAEIDKRSSVIWLDRNVYDSLVVDDWSEVISLSSSVVKEAPFFGKQSRRLLEKNDYWPDYDPNSKVFNHRSRELPTYTYVSNETFFSSSFWASILKRPHSSTQSSFYESGLVKQTLNMKWGR